MDSSGNAIAVWLQYDGTRNSIYSNRYVVGTGWGSAMPIETDNAGSAGSPQVTVDGSGNAVAVWVQWDGTRESILANRYVVGWGWGSATLIDSDSAGNAAAPDVAVDDSGNAIAVWRQYDGTRQSIYSNRYVIGTGWETATLIETDDTGSAYSPQVAVDGSGNAIAVWRQHDGTLYNICANRYVVGTGWGSATPIETDNAGDAGTPQVTVDGSGNAIAVWCQYDGTRFNIWANRYVVGTGWETATLVETDDAGGADMTDVAVDGSGNAITVWRQYDGTRFNIWANRYVVGTGWEIATLIETDNVGSAVFPKVAVDDSGNAIAVWWQWDGTCDNIYSNRYVVGTGWGIATLIETDDAGEASFPQVAIAGSGNAVAVWRQISGTDYNIWSNRYVVPDTTPPSLSLVTPADGLTTETPVVTASGTTEPGVSLVVNGISVAVGSDGSFSCEIALVEGGNTITATATDASDNSATVSVNVTYVNPVAGLEEELNDALEELSVVQDELNDALEELIAVLDELSETQDELSALEDELEVILDDLNAMEGGLNSTQSELNATLEELDDLRNDLNSIQDELDVTEEELTGTSNDLESVKSQNLALMAVLAIVAILAVVMFVMFMSLKKKIAGMDVKPVDEEPPPPQS